MILSLLDRYWQQVSEKEWVMCLNGQGPVGPMRSRPDYAEAVRKFREIKREAAAAGYEINPTIRPEFSISSPTTPRTTIPATRRSRHRSCCYWTICCVVSWSDPRHGGHQHDFKRRERFCSFLIFSRILFASKSDSLVSDGRCKHNTAQRALSHANIISRVAHEMLRNAKRVP